MTDMVASARGERTGPRAKLARLEVVLAAAGTPDPWRNLPIAFGASASDGYGVNLTVITSPSATT